MNNPPHLFDDAERRRLELYGKYHEPHVAEKLAALELAESWSSDERTESISVWKSGYYITRLREDLEELKKISAE